MPASSISSDGHPSIKTTMILGMPFRTPCSAEKNLWDVCFKAFPDMERSGNHLVIIIILYLLKAQLGLVRHLHLNMSQISKLILFNRKMNDSVWCKTVLVSRTIGIFRPVLHRLVNHFKQQGGNNGVTSIVASKNLCFFSYLKFYCLAFCKAHAHSWVLGPWI